MAKSWTSTFDVGKVREGQREGAARGLEQGAAHILDASQRIVPYDKGDLARSGDSGLVSEDRAAVTYRDRGAVASHERTDVPAGNGRQRKFLETSMNRESSEVAEIIAREIRKKLGT